MPTLSPTATNDEPPTIETTTPADGAEAVPLTADITLTFAETVTVSGDWFTLDCQSSGLRRPSLNNIVVWGGPQAYTLDPEADFAQGENCNLTIWKEQVVDQDGSADGMVADYSITFTTIEVLAETALSVYLPLVLKQPPPTPPDLIIDNLLVSGGGVTIVVKNQGGRSVVDAFWVDAYINPDSPPTQVNQRWEDLGDEGLVWGVVPPAIPIAPGGTLTLTLNGDYYVGPPTSQASLPLTVGTAVYAQVDSVNFETDYGNVAEGDEGNNIAGPVGVTVTARPLMTWTAVGEPPVFEERQLPHRK